MPTPPCFPIRFSLALLASLAFGAVGCTGPKDDAATVTRALKGRDQPVAPAELRQKVVAALARAKSPVDLDAKGWVLGSQLEWPQDGPLLWDGDFGLRIPVNPSVPGPDGSPQKDVLVWHSWAFHDGNDGGGSLIDPSWMNDAPSYVALDMRSGELIGADQKSVTEYKISSPNQVSRKTIPFKANAEPTTVVGEIHAGPKAASPDTWPEHKDAKPAFPFPKPVDWSTDIVIDGPEEDQLAVRSFLFYLRTAIPRTTAFQLSPMGRSSEIYKGHVFWDADMWFVPALAFIDPQPLMNSFAEYRSLRLQSKGAPFVWESSSSGKETAPGSMQREIHINGDVLWNLNFMAALGAKVPDLPKITKAVGHYFDGQLTPRPGQPGVYDLKNVVSPDESHTGDNDLYTNLLATWSLKQAGINKTLFLPKDDQTFLTYENDKLRGYKQAAAILSIFPLQYPPAEAQAKQMVDRFADKVIANGPAMSESIDAVIYARLGDPDAAYTHWQNSWKPFMRGPLMLFSEKRNSTRTYFTTGAAGSLQSVIYGFLGFRVDDRPMKGAAWTKKLLNGKWLSISPHLPAAWRAVTFKNFAVLDKRYTLTVRRENGVQTVSVK